MNGTERYDELDAARGIAIVMMILFHTLFDLNFFGIYPVNVTSGFWRYFSFATGTLFLLIAGISLFISHARVLHSATPLSETGIWIKYLKRGAGIFACGVLVTVATWIYIPQSFIIFGILHLIGISIMLSPVFFRFKRNNILIGVVMIAIGFILWILSSTGPFWLLWIGFHPTSFSTIDYYPILPWTGVILVGFGIGDWIYPDGKRAFVAPQIPQVIDLPLTLLGRHSLVIYLVHQPLIILLLHFVAGIPLV